MFEKIKSLLVENRNLRQVATKNAFWLTVGNLGGRILRAVVIILAARVLGPTDYGAFAYALSLAAFLTIFSDIGVGAILTRETVRSPELRESYLSTSFFIKVILVAITIGATLVFAPMITKIEAAQPLIPLMVLLLVFDGFQILGASVARAENKMEWEAGLSILTNIFIVGLSLVVVTTLPSSFSLALAYTLGSGLGLLATAYFLRSYLKGIFSNFKKVLVVKILASAWPFAVMGLLGSIMVNVDTIMLGWFRSGAEVGFYGAAQRPIHLLYTLPTIIATSIFPITTQLIKNKESGRLQKILEKALTGSTLLALPILLGGIVLGKEIISLLYGADYLPATSAFQILLGNLIIIFPGIILSNMIFAFDKQKVFIRATALGLAGNLALNLFLIPEYGIVGSGIATVVAQLMVNGYIWREAKKLQQFIFVGRIKKILLSSGLMTLGTVSLVSLGVSPILNVLISAGIYVGLLWLFKEPFLREFRVSLEKER